MKIAITGAGGNLGRATIPRLSAQGHTLRLLDTRPVEGPYESLVVDVRDRDAVSCALEGCDAVIHAAALHGIHLNTWARNDFWEINVTGSFNVFEAAKIHGISKVVLCSTMGVYGAGLQTREGAWGYSCEAHPTQPTDVYGLSKTLAEEMGRAYGRWGVETVALRFGMFVPEGTFERYGFRLLFGGVDDRDVAQSVEAALAYKPEGGFDAFNIMAPVPFGESDLEALHTDLAGQLERHYPGVKALIATKGLSLKDHVWWPVIWSTEKAQTTLGYAPEYGFGEFLRAWESNDLTHYPVLGLPWWGV